MNKFTDNVNEPLSPNPYEFRDDIRNVNEDNSIIYKKKKKSHLLRNILIVFFSVVLIGLICFFSYYFINKSTKISPEIGIKDTVKNMMESVKNLDIDNYCKYIDLTESEKTEVMKNIDLQNIPDYLKKMLPVVFDKIKYEVSNVKMLDDNNATADIKVSFDLLGKKINKNLNLNFNFVDGIWKLTKSSINKFNLIN